MGIGSDMEHSAVRNDALDTHMSVSGKQRMCYVGVKSCGCVVAGCVDDPRFAKETAKFIARLVRDGYAVKHVPINEANMRACKCGQLDLTVPTRSKARSDAASAQPNERNSADTRMSKAG
jgi:hypothetical protein